MTQTIIAYIIVGVSVAYTIYSVVKKLKKNSDNKACSDCSCCAKKSGCNLKK